MPSFAGGGGHTVTVALKADISDFVGALGAASAAAAGFAAKAASAAALPGKAAAKSAKSSADAMLTLGEKHSENINRLSRNLAIVGAVGVGIAVGAIKAAADFDAQMSKVAMTGQDARTNLTRLKKAAFDVTSGTKNVGYSATQAGQALEFLAKAGVSADDSISGGLTGALNLAAAGGMSVGDAAEIAATAMSQFQMSGKDVPHIADLLAAGAGKAQGSVEQLGYALKYVGPVAKGMGISVEETVGTLTEFANAGILGEQAGTSMRGILLSMTSPSKVARAEMDKLGISLYKTGKDGVKHFIGMAGAAGELSKALAPLDEEAQNDALGRIFGNAQITGARVLLKGGAAGIQDWTNKVNEAGYAAQAASTRVDNLNGDLQKFKASATNALIGAGQGAQSPLRAVVQQATAVSDVLGKIPPSVSQAGISFAAIAGATALGLSGLGKLTVGLGNTRQAMRELRADGSKLPGVLGGSAKTLGVLGAALAVGTIGAQLLSDKTKPVINNVEKAKVALAGMGKAASNASKNLGYELGPSIDDLFKGEGGKNLVSGHGFFKSAFGDQASAYTRDVNDLGTAMQRVFDPTNYEKVSDWFSQNIGPVFGYTNTDLNKTNEQLDLLDTALASSDPKVAAKNFREVEARANSLGIGMDKILPKLDDYKASLQAQAEALHVTVTDAELLDWMRGKVPAAIQKAQDATVAGTAANLALAQSYKSISQDLKDLSSPQQRTLDQSAALAKSLFAQGDATQAADAASVQYQQSIDDASKVIDKNGRTLSKNKKELTDHTQAGRENKIALLNLASAGKGYVQSLAASGAGTKAMVNATQDARDEFIKAAKAAGLNEKAAGKLADSYGLVPSEVSTTINLFGQALAQAQVSQFLSDLQALPEEEQLKILAIYRDKGAKAAKHEFDNFKKQHPVKPVIEPEYRGHGTAKGKKDLEGVDKKPHHPKIEPVYIPGHEQDLNEWDKKVLKPKIQPQYIPTGAARWGKEMDNRLNEDAPPPVPRTRRFSQPGQPQPEVKVKVVPDTSAWDKFWSGVFGPHALDGHPVKVKVQPEVDGNAGDLAQDPGLKDFWKQFGAAGMIAAPKIVPNYDGGPAAKAQGDLDGLNHTVAKPKIDVQNNAGAGVSKAKGLLDGLKGGKINIDVAANGLDKIKSLLSGLKGGKVGIDIVPNGLEGLASKLRELAKKRQAKIAVAPSGVGSTQSKIDGIKGHKTNIPVTASGVGAAQAAIDGVHGKSVTITVTHVDISKQAATGGYITGPGTATSDSIPAWLSNGEFVMRAAAVRAIGLSQLHSLNSMGGPQRAFAAGGPVGFAAGGAVSPYGSSKTLDVGALVALLTSVAHPLEDIATLMAAVAYQEKKVQQAHALTLAMLTNGKVKRYADAVKARDAAQVKDAEKVAAADKKRADARKAYEAHATAANKKALKDAEKAYDKTAKKSAKDINAKNAAVTKAETPTTGKGKKKKTDEKGQAAVQAYTDQLSKEKDATDALTTAQQALADKQREVADSARQASDTFREAYTTNTTDAASWVDLMTQGATDLLAFNDQVKQLRALGLNETVLQQIISLGATAGMDVASQILSDRALVGSLNSSYGAIQTAADQLGFTAVTGAAGARGGASAAPLTNLPEGFTPAAGGYGAAITYPTATTVPTAPLDQQRIASLPVLNIAPPIIDQAAIALAVQAGLKGMTLVGVVDDGSLKITIDKAIGNLVSGFGRANAA